MRLTFLLPTFLLFLISSIGLCLVQQSSLKLPRFNKVLWIVLENTSASSALKEPYLKYLTSQGAFLENMHGETHPSQPNYVAMVAGDTLGVSGDGNVDLSANHLGDLLENGGRHWKVFADDYPGNCFLGKSAGKYVRKHVPFLSFLNVSKVPNRCISIVNSNSFSADLNAEKLPDFSMYIPNLDNDGHDTGVGFASKYLQNQFGRLFADTRFMQETLVVVTFDEDNWISGNSIYTVLLGAGIKPGTVSNQNLNHISLLKMIEDEWSLGSLNRADKMAEAPIGIWLSPK
jgi:hypothetical protein